jgi:integrase/recombinase XerC
MLADFAAQRDSAIGEFRLRDMRAYLASRRGVVGANTLRHDAITARTFFRWAHENGYVDVDVLARLELPAGETPHIAVPTTDDVRKLLEAVDARQEKHVKASLRRREREFLRSRDRAILCVMAETGLRVSEVAALMLEDFDATRLLLRIRPGKTHKGRDIPVSADLTGVLKAWLARRPKTADLHLFLTVYGDQVKPDSIREWLRRVEAEAGIGHFTLHSLRHYALSELVHRASVLVAREVAGHASIATTNRYASINPDAVRQGVEEAGTLQSILRAPKPRRPVRKKVV